MIDAYCDLLRGLLYSSYHIVLGVTDAYGCKLRIKSTSTVLCYKLYDLVLCNDCNVVIVELSEFDSSGVIGGFNLHLFDYGRKFGNGTGCGRNYNSGDSNALNGTEKEAEESCECVVLAVREAEHTAKYCVRYQQHELNYEEANDKANRDNYQCERN